MHCMRCREHFFINASEVYRNISFSRQHMNKDVVGMSDISKCVKNVRGVGFV